MITNQTEKEIKAGSENRYIDFGEVSSTTVKSGILLVIIGIVLFIAREYITVAIMRLDNPNSSFPGWGEVGSKISTLVNIAGFLLIFAGLILWRGLRADRYFIKTIWGHRISIGFFALLFISTIFGIYEGRIYYTYAYSYYAQPIPSLFYFGVFPAFIIADSIINRQYVYCSLRAAALPLVKGLVIWVITDNHNTFGFSAFPAGFNIIGSVIIVAVAREIYYRYSVKKSIWEEYQFLDKTYGSSVIQWIARICSIASISLLGYLIVLDLINLRLLNEMTLNLGEAISHIFFPLGAFFGLVIAWKWERLGGIVAVASIICFHLTWLIFEGDPELHILIDGVAIPGLLFILHWFISRHQLVSYESN